MVMCMCSRSGQVTSIASKKLKVGWDRPVSISEYISVEDRQEHCGLLQNLRKQ